MRILLGLLGLVVAASAVDFKLKGTYKTNAKYVYHYEGRIRPTQVPVLKTQFIELLINCTVELHPLSHEKFVLKISKHNFTALVSDPKYTDGPVVYRTFGELESLSSFIKKPIKFTYKNGLVQKVYAMKDDPRFSVNLKKGIINLFHVDITGKNPDTTTDDLFTKNEESVIGICSTSYSINEFKVIDARRTWRIMGYNVTKVININNCTKSDFEVYNTVVLGPNEHQSTNPLKSTATIKYNILGSKSAFKIEEVHAVGLHVLYLTTKDEGGIDSVTDQRIKLIRKEAVKSDRDIVAMNDQNVAQQTLSMNVRSFGNIEKVPEFSESDRKNSVELIFRTMTKLMKMVPEFEKPSKHSSPDVYLENFSKNLLQVLQIVRSVKKLVHNTIWSRCSSDPKMKKWILHVYSLCGTQACMEFMKDKLNTLTEELISSYLITSSYNGNPTELMTKFFKEMTLLGKVTASPSLTKIAYLSATNVIKTFCRQNKCKATWIDEVLTNGLKNIIQQCKHKLTCKPMKHLPATVMLALVENVERPTLFTHLEKIVLDESLAVMIRVKAVMAIRPMIKIIPTRVRVLMLRVFRDLSSDIELRTVCFSVLMENPSFNVILHIARVINLEPSRCVRRFVYDKWVAMKYTKTSTPKIDNALRLALELFSKTRVPPRLGQMTNSYHLNWYSKNWTVGALWRHDEIYRSDFMPTFVHSRLNITVFGRNITLLEGQLRVQGLEEYLRKLIGPNGLFDISKTDALKKSGIGALSDKLKELEKKLPTYSLPEEKLKLFFQMKMFGKVFYATESSLDTPASKLNNYKSFDGLLNMVEFALKLHKGLEYKFSKPFIPIEVIYRMPTLIGVTLTTNLTSMVIPVSVSRLKVTAKPDMFSLETLVTKKIDSVQMNAEQQLCAIADVHGEINFRIPNLVLGGYMRTTVNVSAHLKANINFDTKSRTLKTEVETPETVREVLTLKKKAYHFLTVENPRGKTSRPEKKILKVLDKKEPERIIKRERRSFYSDDADDFDPEMLPERKLKLGGNKLDLGKIMTAWNSKTTTTTGATPLVFATPLPTTTRNVETTTDTTTTETPTMTVTTETPWMKTTAETPKMTTTAETPTITTTTETPTITTTTEAFATTETMRTTETMTTTTEISPTTSTSMQPSSSATVEPVNPSVPVSDHEAGKTLRIPIEVDQLKHIKVLGSGKKPAICESWTLKFNGKFVSVNSGKVVLSSTPTVFNVTFHGKNRRIVRFFAPGHGFLTIPTDHKCLKTTKQKSITGQLFVITMTGPGKTKIRSVAHYDPKMIPKEWSLADARELREIEEIEQIFQKEQVTLDKEYLDDEEKVEPNRQTARMVYWTANNDAVCLTPFEKAAKIVHVNRKTSLTRNLRRLSYQLGKCYGTSMGLAVCQHGYRPYPKLNHLPLIYAPMEYRLLLKPVTKPRVSKIKMQVVMPNPSDKILKHEVTLAMTGQSAEKRMTITTSFDRKNDVMSLTVVPVGLETLQFKKMCMKFARRIDGVSFSISLDPSCTKKNIKVDLVTAKQLPRYWMTFVIKHSSSHVPQYVIDRIKYITSTFIIPTLKNSVYVYPRVHVPDLYNDTSKLYVSLVKNDTLKLHLKTKYASYVLDDVKLPMVIRTLPKGTKEIPLLSKLLFIGRSHCLHRNQTFVTFDKKPYNFTLRGHCEHNLLRICDGSSNKIAVTMKKIDDSMKRKITILVDSKVVEIIPKTKMEDKPTIKINGRQLPMATRFVIKDQSNHPMITMIWEPEIKCVTFWHHRYGLIVKLVESHLVTLRISPFFANKTCGLCGNNDGEHFNEFITPEGSLVNDARRPTIFYPKVKQCAETIFASSWVTPSLKCSKDCPFTRKFVKVSIQGKTCLTNFRILQCFSSCKESEPQAVLVPATCVPPSKVEQLEKFLTHGTKIDLSQATEFLAKISIPKNCRCNC